LTILLVKPGQLSFMRKFLPLRGEGKFSCDQEGKAHDESGPATGGVLNRDASMVGFDNLFDNG
jgi:hypothetical protein